MKKPVVKSKAGRGVSRRRAKPRSRAGSLQSTANAIDEIHPKTRQAARLLTLLSSWLADESGYDERTWPKLQRALDQERSRVGARRLFDA